MRIFVTDSAIKPACFRYLFIRFSGVLFIFLFLMLSFYWILPFIVLLIINQFFLTYYKTKKIKLTPPNESMTRVWV